MITVTGAVSQTGLLTIKELINKGVPPADLIAISDDEGPFTSGGDLQALGVQVRTADLTDLETVAAAVAGTEKLVLFPFTGAETYEPLANDLFTATGTS
jgi:NAD(P)H dehydrogenase (quinone)